MVDASSKGSSRDAETRTSLEPRFQELEFAATILARDRKAAAEFVARYVDDVYAYVRRRLIPRTDRVDDLVQETFLAAFDNLRQFRGASSLRTWLLGIARHKVDDYYRELFRRPEPVGVDEPDALESESDEPALEDFIDQKLLEKKVRHILSQLPEMYAFVLLWRYWDRRRTQEIAELTGKSEKAIERLLARARAEFKRKWNHE